MLALFVHLLWLVAATVSTTVSLPVTAMRSSIIAAMRMCRSQGGATDYHARARKFTSLLGGELLNSNEIARTWRPDHRHWSASRNDGVDALRQLIR
jgi:hypothetical protein